MNLEMFLFIDALEKCLQWEGNKLQDKTKFPFNSKDRIQLL